MVMLVHADEGGTGTMGTTSIACICVARLVQSESGQ